MTTAAYLLLGAVLFGTGALGTLVRASAVGRLVGVELMLGAAILTFAAAAAGLRELDGQVAALLVVAVAVAQSVVGFSLIAGVRRSR
ncbi:MAG TPA: NADH-quinone oxidoreductase subunit NuoK [Candidatus Limnocylindria bacterium]